MLAFLVALLLLAVSPQALGQTTREAVQESVFASLVGTHNVRANQKTERNVPIGCGMEFTQGVRDYVSRQGGLVVVNGSIEVLVQRGQGIGLFWTLKLVPKDMTLDHNLKPILVTFNPSYGYIRTQNFASAQRERGAFQCESGGICLGFTDDLHEIVELLGSPRFTVAILRWPDSFDLTSMVDMSGRQAMQQQVEFFSCLERLTGYWENRLPK